MSYHLDGDVDAERHAEGDPERLRVIILERLAHQAGEARRIGGPDDGCDEDPADEPRARLAGDATGQSERRATARYETGGDQQQPSAVLDLLAGPVELGGDLRFAISAAFEGSRPPPTYGVCHVVADEGPARTGGDDSQQRVRRRAGGHSDGADDDGGLAGHHRNH